MSYEIVVPNQVILGDAFPFIGTMMAGMMAGIGLILVGFAAHRSPDDGLPTYIRLLTAATLIVAGIVMIILTILKTLGITITATGV